MSVVVLSRNAPPELVDAVSSLGAQRPRPEIIVVNSGRPGAAERVRAAGVDAAVIECRTRLFPGAARDVGIAAAHGRWIAFLAADCVAGPGWVAHRLAVHRAGARVVSSPVVNAHPWNPFAEAGHLLLFSRRLPGTPRVQRLHYGASYELSLFRQHGAFRPDLRIAEDTEFHERLGRAARPRFASAVHTAHRNPRGLRALVRDQYARGRRAALAYASLGGRPSPEQVARDALRRIPHLLRIAFRATPGRHWPRLVWALPWVLVGGPAYARGARSVGRPQSATQAEAHPTADPSPYLVCMLQIRNERHYVHDYLENVAPHVDGIVVLDDASSDGTGDLLAAHPKVLEVLRIEPREPHRWDEARSRRLLVDAAGRHGARWIIAVDADERLECEFRKRADLVLQRAEADGVQALRVTIRELWGAPDHYRADGIWGRKSHPKLFRFRVDHEHSEMALHGPWAPLNSQRPGGGFADSELVLYHQRMIHAGDREGRRRRYERLDPDRRFQAIGYEYLTDVSGLERRPLPPGRGYEPLPAPVDRVEHG